MLLVKTIVKQSEGRGLGLFAAQDIKKNKIVWLDASAFDRKFTKEEHDCFPQVVKDWMVEYAPFDGKFYHVDIDNFKYTNHSYTPNINLNGTQYFANQDIKEGEEIFCDYSEFDAEFKDGTYKFNII